MKAGADVNTWSTCIVNIKFNTTFTSVPDKYYHYIERIGLNVTDVDPNDRGLTSPLIDAARFGNHKCVDFTHQSGKRM